MLRSTSAVHFSSYYPAGGRRPVQRQAEPTAQPPVEQPKRSKAWLAVLVSGIASATASLITAGMTHSIKASADSNLGRIESSIRASKAQLRTDMLVPPDGGYEDTSMQMNNRRAFVAAMVQMVRETQPVVAEMRDIRKLLPELRDLWRLEKLVYNLNDEQLDQTDIARKDAKDAKTPEEFAKIVANWAEKADPVNFKRPEQKQALIAYSKELFQVMEQARALQNQFGLYRNLSLGALALNLMLSALGLASQRKQPQPAAQ